MALTDKLTNIADAIREKTGSTRTMNLEEMAAAVTNIKIPTALSDLNEDETHRTVTDAEKKTWNDKSNFSGNYDDLKNKQLAGTTDELTPTQVYAAVSTGKPVKVQYTDRTYGALFFTAFNVAESLNAIVSQTIVYVNGVYILAELNGNKSDNTWGFNTTTLAQKTDIPDEGGNKGWTLLYDGTITIEEAVKTVTVSLLAPCEGMVDFIGHISWTANANTESGMDDISIGVGKASMGYGRIGKASNAGNSIFQATVTSSRTYWGGAYSTNNLEFNKTNMMYGFSKNINNANYENATIDFFAKTYAGTITLQLYGR